jgi:hypothetical protein
MMGRFCCVISVRALSNTGKEDGDIILCYIKKVKISLLQAVEARGVARG